MDICRILHQFQNDQNTSSSIRTQLIFFGNLTSNRNKIENVRMENISEGHVQRSPTVVDGMQVYYPRKVAAITEGRWGGRADGSY